MSLSLCLQADLMKWLQGANDVQTEADRRVQHCILASLNKQFPDVAVIAEEVKCIVWVMCV